jgi:hypothetical protein
LSSPYRSLRRRILTPGVSNTKISVRGFHEKSPEARDLLETVGRSFLEGYAFAAEAGSPLDAEAGLEAVPDRFRGFAYEGAGMGFAVRDALPLGRSDQGRRFLEGRARDHVYMVYVGAGWALARIPRFTWPKIELGDALLRWLMLDGYGFHQAYFKTEKYVRQQYQEPDFPFEAHGTPEYCDHVIDQGIGRAMWFVGGSDPALVADMIDEFAPARQPDLWAGSGLAATYAGGVTEEELAMFKERAGRFAPNLAQGSAFAATARVEAGNPTEHTVLAARVLCGITPEEATKICGETRPDPAPEVPGHPGVPSFEIWRRRITEAIVMRNESS